MRVQAFWTRFRRPKFFALFAAMVACLIGLPLGPTALQATTPRTSTIRFVSPDWVAANANDPNLHILDVRNIPLDYTAGHVPQAVNIADLAFRGPDGFLPFQYWNPEKLGSIFAQAGVTNQDRVLVYSDGRDILGATMVAYLLERSGARDISVLDGGYSGYKAAGQPVTKAFPRYPQKQFTVRDNPAIRVTLAEVKELLGKPGVVFIDPRPGDLFRGEKDIWIRNGHIPGARNMPWVTFTEADNPQESLKNPHKLKPLPEIRKLLADRGITPADDIIVSCSTGREATLQYVVLKHLLGYPKVRIYEGSWTEYSTTDLPIATGAEKSA